MIVDRLDAFSRYAGLGQHFETAVRFVEQHDLNTLPLGRTDVDGDNVFVNVSENVYDREDMFWEAHNLYADVQVILKGSERFGWGSACDRAEPNGDLVV